MDSEREFHFRWRDFFRLGPCCEDSAFEIAGAVEVSIVTIPMSSFSVKDGVSRMLAVINVHHNIMWPERFKRINIHCLAPLLSHAHGM